MKKNIVQDVVPPKKSIRNVKISSKKATEKPVKESSFRNYAEEVKQEEDFSRPVPITQAPIRIEPVQKPKIEEPNDSFAYKYEYSEKKKSSKKWIYIVLTLFVFAIAFGVSSMFKSANVKYTPKQQSMAINKNYVAKIDSVTGLSFQTVTVTKEVEQTAKSTGEEKVERKARGQIIIYNNYSKDVQKLVATTRFQTPEGLIYRLVSPVTVPGTTLKDGKTVAGSIEVTVEADKPGISYNVGLKDFTIPGFKGDPKYTAIYARSKTEMTNGFSGMQKTVSKDVLAKADTELQSKLREELQKDINAQIPANFLSYPDGLSYEFEPTIAINSTTEGSDVVLKKKGQAIAIIFDRSALTKTILSDQMPNLESGEVKISNLDSLTFKKNVIPGDNEKQITFNLSGEAKYVWEVDDNALKNDLIGLNKKSAMTVISKYGGVSEAWIETKPFWNQRIPTDVSKINVVNTLGEN